MSCDSDQQSRLTDFQGRCRAIKSAPPSTNPTARHIGNPVFSGVHPMHSGLLVDNRAEMASARIKLDPQATEAIARKVVELLESTACRSASWSMPPSWRRCSGSSGLGCTPTRSSLGRSSSAAGRSLGFGLIHRSPLGFCGGLAKNRRLTRPPARVSGRISLRPAEEAECGCFRSASRGRTSRLLRLR